ncbi:TonB-dependent receptor [Aestuariivivens insulae]|uniref:TonB-dependent receptor n=1 Tax=Aestuariivivens insulae TaxID=1621988 RepID=UPI001F5A1FA3|nr:TonB-dependent receptor [Aestuariivivens insulae]
MKLTLLLVFASFFSMFANDSYSQTISLDVEDMTVANVISKIESTTEYRFVYNTKFVNLKRKVTVNAKETDIADFLENLFGNTQTSFKVRGTQIVLKKKKKADLVLNTTVQAPKVQELEVTGQIIDNTGMPLAGATITVKGTSRGVTSDFDGNYKIKVNENEVLVYSYVGYKTQELPVNGQTVINVTLLEDVDSLEEILVVAYGTQKKEAITSSVVSIKSDELKDITTPDVSSMLQGKAAGVQITPASGEPGSVPSILIRGKSTFNGSNAPLWVVDGVIQHDTPIINPNDVASISVLKDASATSLYGSSGANGVVIVTTKRGSLGKSEITISSKIAMNELNTGGFEVMNSQQLYDYHTQFGNSNPWFSEDLLSRDTDWLELGSQTGIVKETNVTFTSGTEKLNLFINGGIYNETGTLRGNELDRYTFRMNLDYNISERLKIMPKVSFSFDDRDRIAQAPLYELYLNLPWDLPYDADGMPVHAQESQDWLGRDSRNYLYDQQWNYSSNNTFNMSGNFDFEYKIIPNLKFNSANNFTLYRYLSKDYTDPRSNSGQSNGGSISDYTANRLTRYTLQSLTYSNSFNDHSIKLMGGYEFRDYAYESFGVSANNITAGSEILNNATEPGNFSGLKNDYAFQAFFLYAEYDYKDRYFLKASIRRDGSSRFAGDKEYGNFYSVGASWLIHKEDFFKSNIVNELKLRVSQGEVGNLTAGLYPYQGTFRLGPQYIGEPGVQARQFPNLDLGWEKSSETNIGIDAKLFDRIDISLDYYNKDTKDLVWRVPLRDSQAFSHQWRNVGGITNKGVEAVLSADIVQNESFNWNVGVNIGANKNKVAGLFEGDELPRGNKIWKVGMDQDTWYMRKWAGVHPANGDPLWEKVDTNTGEVSYTSSYDEATVQILDKSSTPDFIGGFNSSWNYKGLSLAVNFDFSSGSYLYNASRELFDSDGFYSTFNQQVLADSWSRWENPGDMATHPRAVDGGNQNSNKPSSRYLEDASYLRMRNITLSYNLPQKVLQKIGLSKANVYVSGDNLFTITNYSGVSPVVTGNPNDNDGPGLSGSPSLTYPIPRRYVFGVNVSF